MDLPLLSLVGIGAIALAPGNSEAQGLLGGGGPPEQVECIGPRERAAVAWRIALFERRFGRLSSPSSASPPKFTFYPLGGTLYGDVYTNNFVDLDAGAGVLDWDCTDYSYNGHDATDVDLRTFGEQSIGVPVFAALDGVVVSTHDGEPDMNTSCTGTANHVVIDHGMGRVCYYWHLKNGSVAVSVGQSVLAGEEIGLVASSGCSTYPHLHFATYDSGGLVEPYAGACRPGASEWTDQEPIERSLYLRDLNVTNADISSYPGLPFDMPRKGSFVQGVRTVRFWIMLANQPAGSTWRVRFRRPNATIALDSGTVGFGNPFYRWAWWYWGYNVNLNATGTWHILLDIDGATLAEAPLEVVATAGDVVNRPPNAITAAIEPAVPTWNDVLICRVGTDLVEDDLDYDIVRYRYVWTVDGTLVRDVTTAGHKDVLPRRAFAPGLAVRCEVTPSDGTDDGPTAVAEARFRIPRLRPELR